MSRPRERGVPGMSLESPVDTARTKPGPPGLGRCGFQPRPGGWSAGGKSDNLDNLRPAGGQCGNTDGKAAGCWGRGRPARGLHGDGKPAEKIHVLPSSPIQRRGWKPHLRKPRDGCSEGFAPLPGVRHPAAPHLQVDGAAGSRTSLRRWSRGSATFPVMLSTGRAALCRGRANVVFSGMSPKRPVDTARTKPGPPKAVSRGPPQVFLSRSKPLKNRRCPISSGRISLRGISLRPFSSWPFSFWRFAFWRVSSRQAFSRQVSWMRAFWA